MTRPLVPEDWRCLETYAPRVRDLGYKHLHTLSGQSVRHPVNLSVFEAFRSHHPKSPLLPRLQRIRVINFYWPFLDLLLAPSLVSISICLDLCWTVRSEHQLITAVLMDIQVRCSELQELFVDGTSTSPGAQWSYIAHLLPMRQSPAPVGLQAEVITRLAAASRGICGTISRWTRLCSSSIIVEHASA